MSEEVASADSLLKQNAELSRQIGELNTMIGYQDAMLRERESQLGTAQAEITRLEAALRWAAEMKTIKGSRAIVARTLPDVKEETE